MPVVGRRSSHEMIEKHREIVHGIDIGNGDGRTGEMSIANGVAEHHGVVHVVAPVRPIGVFLDQRLEDDRRSFGRIGRNIIVIQFQMFDKRGITDVGLHVARRLLVPLSVNHKVRTFVPIGTEQQRTFLAKRTVSVKAEKRDV